jgi:hypothetical protein
MFRYPSPSLTSLSLRLNSSTSVSVSDDGFYSYVNIPSSGSSVWLVFSGSNFGEFSDQVSVIYKNSALNGTTFPCIVNGLSEDFRPPRSYVGLPQVSLPTNISSPLSLEARVLQPGSIN